MIHVPQEKSRLKDILHVLLWINHLSNMIHVPQEKSRLKDIFYVLLWIYRLRDKIHVPQEKSRLKDLLHVLWYTTWGIYPLIFPDLGKFGITFEILRTPEISELPLEFCRPQKIRNWNWKLGHFLVFTILHIWLK